MYQDHWNSNLQNTQEVSINTECSCSNKDDCCAPKFKNELLCLISGLILYAGALLLEWNKTLSSPNWLIIFLFFLSYISIGWDILRSTWKNLSHGNIFNEFLLMTLATIGAFFIGAYAEAVAVMLFYKIGEKLQDKAVNKSRKSISSLLALRPELATVIRKGKLKYVNPNIIQVGEIVQVKTGEKVPLDGEVIKGKATLDSSALTGEPMPISVFPGDTILSGMINQSGLLNIKVIKPFSESTLSKILDLVENATAKKAPIEHFITRFARFYTPAVVFLALGIIILPFTFYHIPTLNLLYTSSPNISDWLYKALVFLVISCPCALVISIPLGFYAGIGAASKKGILIKGANFLEGLSKMSILVWDKTGTLTQGDFQVSSIVNTNGFSKKEILKWAALAAANSNHPIAQSISKSYHMRTKNLQIEEYQEFSGLGLSAKVNGTNVLVGNDKLLHKFSIKHNCLYLDNTVVHVAIDGVYAGYIIISDRLREKAKTTIQALRKYGIKQYMFTGDNQKEANSLASKLNLDGVFAELLPNEKVEKMEGLLLRKRQKEVVAFVGDGINDAPVLTRADIGIAMGEKGIDAAIEAADVVLMQDMPEKLLQSIQISKKTKMIIWENIIFALSIKLFILGLGFFGFATMWEAVFADVGVSLLAILNTIRLLK